LRLQSHTAVYNLTLKGIFYRIQQMPKEIIILNALALSYYFIIIFQMESPLNEDTMFYAADAYNYVEMMEWFKGNSETEFTQIRPLLFPLFIFIPFQLFGVYGIWLLQVVFWLLSINFIYLSIKKLTNKTLFAVIGAIVIAANLSYIAMTMHTLTEVTTIFLLSILGYIFCENQSKILEPFVLNRLMFVLVLMTLIKPLFFIPVLIVLGVFFPFFYLKKYLIKPKQFIFLSLAILPLIAQMTFVKIKHQHFTVSTIGSYTFKYYYFAQGMSEIENTPRPEIDTKIENYSIGDQFEYILLHKEHYYKWLCRTIEKNIKGLPVFVKMEDKNEGMVSYMLEYNYWSYHLHKVFLILFVPTLILLLAFKKQSKNQLLILLILGAINYYILFASGISYWQGDRLTLPSLAIWPLQYFFTVHILCLKLPLLLKKNRK